MLKFTTGNDLPCLPTKTSISPDTGYVYTVRMGGGWHVCFSKCVHGDKVTERMSSIFMFSSSELRFEFTALLCTLTTVLLKQCSVVVVFGKTLKWTQNSVDATCLFCINSFSVSTFSHLKNMFTFVHCQFKITRFHICRLI